MKFKPLLFVLAITFSFSSCSSDDDTVENRAPNAFNLTQPADATGGVATQPQLSWDAATDPDGDSVTYKVYLDTQNPPQIAIANDLGVNTYTLQTELEPETTYYWRVIATDVNGNTTESAVASFTSRDMTPSEAIVGKWFYESLSGQPEFTACQKQNFLKFTDDLFLLIRTHVEVSAGECTVNEEASFSYEISGDDQIVATSNGSSQNITIQSLTQTELVIVFEGSDLALTLLKE